LSLSPDKAAFFFSGMLRTRRMTTPSLNVTELACRRGGRRVFDGLSFSVTGGELLALTGRNGSGKTTLLRALASLGRAEAGTIAWRGADIAWLGHLDGLKGDLTVAENIDVAERLRGAAPDCVRIDAALASFDLTSLAARPVRTLSAGQRRRTALARVADSRANAWLLDEPLNALDAPAQAALRAVLASHLAAGGLALAATHAPLEIAGARALELGT
jgi:heme exporter protein A